jgi:hypothetical protein
MEKRSCADAIFDYVHRFNKAVDEGYKSTWIFIDIAAAFSSLLDFDLFESLVDTELDLELI